MNPGISQELSFTLRPASNLRRLDDADAWEAVAGPVRFELDPGRQAFPSGWVLVTGRVTSTILDGSARLLIEHARGQLSLDIPVSRAGSVFELVNLPPDIRQIVWEPSRADGAFRHTPLRVSKIGFMRRTWLMARRVAFMLWTRPADQKARAGLGWHKTLYDLRGQYRASGTLRAFGSAMPYAQWFERYMALSELDRKRIRRRIRKLSAKPHFAVVVSGQDAGAPGIAATLKSIEEQLYRRCSAVVSAPGSDVRLPRRAEYVMFLDAGDRLAEHALYWAAESVARRGDLVMTYCDEDVAADDGTLADPRFKPAWSPEHLRSIDYIGRGAIVRRAELEAAGGLGATRDAYAVLLRLADTVRKHQVVHIPAPLLHRHPAGARAEPLPRRRYPVPKDAPLISIIIPTRDRLALLRKCVDTVERRSTYPRIEILVIDNRTSEPEALKYLRELEHRVLPFDAEYNFAAICNAGVRAARGEVVVLLNNDTEVISPDWLEEMLGHLLRDGVGAVGAKLYYPDGRVQHAGDAVGIGGGAHHLHNGLARGAPGYCYRAVVAQEVSAVTAACLMTPRDLYLRMGGLDEERFPISFNDVDYCLRLQEAGYRVIFTPHAELTHHESASRGDGAASPTEAAAARALRRRWRGRLRRDPYYNPNLRDEVADFSLAHPPRVARPWLK